MPEATVMVADVVQRSGEKNGRAWTMTKIVDGNGVEYPPTFDKKLAVAVLGLKGKRADLVWDGDMEKGKLTHATEHVEAPKAGSYGKSPQERRHIGIQNALYHATAVVNVEYPEPLTVNERVKRIKVTASDIALWGHEWAERADTELPFSESEDDGIPFGE